MEEASGSPVCVRAILNVVTLSIFVSFVGYKLQLFYFITTCRLDAQANNRE